GARPSFANLSSYNSLNSEASAISGTFTTFLNPRVELKLIVNFPALAFLVVTIITPLAPLTPKMAKDEASFRISIDSISLGLTKLISSAKIPSTTYKGLVLYLLLVPLILISGSCPSLPEFTTESPETLPCNEATGFDDGLSSTTSPDTVTIEPVKSLFCAVPYPITTTSSSKPASSCKLRVYVFSPVTVNSYGIKPKNVTLNTSPSTTLFKVNSPSKLVTSKISLPITLTSAPGSGIWLASEIVPVTVFVCCAIMGIPIRNNIRNNNFKFI